jgi:ABC-type sugar transport system substrate-binding protein
MRLSKRLMATVLLLAGVLVGGPAFAEPKAKIGLTMSSFEFDFHQQIMAGAKKWADDHGVDPSCSQSTAPRLARCPRPRSPRRSRWST